MLNCKFLMPYHRISDGAGWWIQGWSAGQIWDTDQLCTLEPACRASPAWHLIQCMPETRCMHCSSALLWGSCMEPHGAHTAAWRTHAGPPHMLDPVHGPDLWALSWSGGVPHAVCPELTPSITCSTCQHQCTLPVCLWGQPGLALEPAHRAGLAIGMVCSSWGWFETHKWDPANGHIFWQPLPYLS